jgi:hypothetical protein
MPCLFGIKIRCLCRNYENTDRDCCLRNDETIQQTQYMSLASVTIPAAHRIWAFIYLAGESSCRSVQYIVRPHLNLHIHWINYLLGVAPNFLAGIYVPACYTFLMPYIIERNPNLRIFDPLFYRFSACVFALFGVLGWEIAQQFTRKFYFDPDDILWTFVGVGVYWIITQWFGTARTVPILT